MGVKHRRSDKIPAIPVGADVSPAYAEVDKFINDVSTSRAAIKVDADVSAANGRIKRFMQTIGKSMLIDANIDTKGIENAIDKVGKKAIKIDVESPRMQTVIKEVLKDAEKLALGYSAAINQGQDKLAQGWRQTLGELLDQFGDLSTTINGELVTGIENILEKAEDLSSLGPITFKTEGLEQAQDLTAKTAENVEQIASGLSKQTKEANKATAAQKKLTKAYLDSKKVFEVKSGDATFIFPTKEKAEQHANNIRGIGSEAEIAEKKLGQLDEKLREVYESQYYKPSAGYKPGKTFQLKGKDLETYLDLISGHSDFKSQHKNLLKKKNEGASSVLIKPNQKMLDALGFMLDKRTDISSDATDLLERILTRRLESQEKIQALLEQGRSDATSSWADMAGDYDGLKKATEQQEKLTAAREKDVKVAAKQAQEQMKSTAELIGRLHSKFDSKQFDDIFGDTMKAFDSLNVDNAKAMYDALIAKEQEYYDTIKKRAEATASLTTLANEQFQDYAGIEEFRNKLTSLISDIMEGNATFEDASGALKEFANTLSIANPDISSYQGLYKALEKLVSLSKQLRPDWIPEFSEMQSMLDKSGFADSKEDLIADIKAQYGNVQRIKASKRNGLDIYKHIEGSGYEAQYGIDKNTLKDAENMLRGYIYQAVERFGYTTADVMNDFDKKGIRTFVENVINKHLTVSSQNDIYQTDAEAFNAPIQDAIESIVSAIYSKAADSKSANSVSDDLSELRHRAEDVNRYTLSVQTNSIGRHIGIDTPYNEIKANAEKIESYEELCEVITRYNELQKDAVIFGGNEYPGLDEAREIERQRLMAKIRITGGQEVFKLSGVNGFSDIDQVAKALGITKPVEVPATPVIEPGTVQEVITESTSGAPVEVPITPVVEPGAVKKAVEQDISTMVPGDIIDKITQGVDIEKMLTDRGLQGEQLTKGIDLFKDFAGSLYLGDSSPESSTDLFNELFDFVTQNAQKTKQIEKTLGNFRERMKLQQIRIPEEMEDTFAAEFVDSWKDLQKLYAIGGNSKNKKKLLTTSKYVSTPDTLVEQLIEEGFGSAFDSKMLENLNGSAQDSLRMLLDAIQRAKDEFGLPKTQTILGLNEEEQLDFSAKLIEAVNTIEQNVTALHAPLASASADNDTLAESAERAAPALEREATSAERAAEAMRELQEAENDLNKRPKKDGAKAIPTEKAVDLLEKDTLASLDVISAAERRTRTGYNFDVSTTDELQKRFSAFAEALSGDTGMKVGKIKVGTKLATLELYNDELKKAIRYTYQLTEAEEDGRRELKLVNEEYAQNIKALQENKFDVAGYQAIAQREVGELRASLKGLKTPSNINFEQLDRLAGDIKGKDDWTAFENQVKAAKKSVDTLKQSISTSNSMNTLVSAVRGMENSEATIRDYQVALNELGDIPGIDKAKEKLDAMTEAARKYKEEAKTGEDQVKFFNEFNDNEVAFKSLLSGLSDLSKMTADMKTAEIDIRRMQHTLDGFKDVYGVEDATAELKLMTEALDEFNDTSDITKKASARQKYISAESKLKSIVAELRESQKGRLTHEDMRSIQDRLYKSKKNYAALEMSGTASESELQAAQRLTEELEQQYQTSLYLAKTADDYYAAKQRELQLEKELQSVQQEQHNAELDRIARAEEVSDAEKSKQETAQYEREQDALAKARLELQKEKFQAQREEKAGRDALLKAQKEQDKLYEQKKKFAKLEHDESATDSDLKAAERKTEEFERQYEASTRLLRTEEDYNAIKQRELQLEDELRTVQEEQYEIQRKRLEAAEEKNNDAQTKQEKEWYNKEQDALDAAKAERDKAIEKLNTFSRWKSDIKNIAMLSDETAERIKNIGNEIAHIGDNTDVKKLAEDFEKLQSDVKYETTQSKATKDRIAEIKDSFKAEQAALKTLFGQLDLELDLGDKAPNAKEIEQSYNAATEAIKKCTSATGEQSQEEVAAAMRTIALAKEKMQARLDAESIWWGGNGNNGNPPDGGNPPLDENKIKQWYQTLNSTIQQISKIEAKMHGLMLKDDGTGVWAPLIESLDSQRSELLNKVRDIGKEINAAFGGQFVQGEQIDLPFSNILSSIKDFDAPTTIADFFSDIRTQTVLSEQAIEKFVTNLQAAQNKTDEFSTGMKEGIYSTLQSSETTLNGLFKNGLVDPDNEKYKLAVKELLAYQEAIKSLTDVSTGKLTDPASWTTAQVIGILEMTNALNKYTSEVKTGALAEAQYFEAKRQYANVSSTQNYDDVTASMEKTSNSTNDAKAKLEDFVSKFEGGQKVITGFTTSANGISRIDFSVLEEGTGNLRSFSAEMGQFTNNIYTVENSLKNMTVGTKSVESALTSMQQIMDRLNARGFTPDNNDYVADLQKRMQALKEAYITGQGDQGQLQNSAMDAERLLSTLKQLENAYLNIKDAQAKGEAVELGQFDKNTDSAEQFANALKMLEQQFDGTVVDVGKFNGEINQIPVAIETADGKLKKFIIDVDKLSGTMVASLKGTEKAKTGLQEFMGSFTGGIGKTMKSAFTYFFSFYDFVRYFRKGFNEVLEIDTAMTELKKVTDETDVAYSNFLKNAYTSSKKIGTTMKDFTQATADFARLGYTLDEASMLSEAANVYMNVGDGIDNVEDASKSIISTMKAFGIEAEDSMSIVNKFNEVGNNFAIDSVGIGEAFQRSASALFEAGNTIDESIALVTGANTVIQNPEQVGTALKTLALRLRGAKVELEEAGLETDNMAESTSTLQAKLQALTHGRVDIMEDAETFKSTTQILREMADAWEYMTDIERASALELMGGKRQANILSSLIGNFDIVEDVINTSLNSENSAIEENEKYMDSMQGRIDQLNNSMQSMWVNALDSDFLKFIISVADAFVQLTDEVGLFNMAIAAFMGRTAFKSQKFGILNWLQGQKGIISSTAPTNTAEAQAQDADTAATERNTAATNANIQAEQASAQASMQAAAADNAEAQAAAVAASADATETGASSAEAAAEQVEAASSIASATADAAEASSSMAAASADIAEAQASIQAASADTVEQAASNGAAAADAAEAAGSAIAAAGDAAEAAASGVSVLVGGLAAGTTAFKLFNAAATMGISLLAGMFISGLMEVVDELNVTSEEIQDAAKQAESAIQSLSGDFKKNEKFVSSNAKRFAELAQGVDVLNGKNVSLNTEEYNEFLNLSNQLADTFPSLSRVYDENGNAIVQLSGSTDTIVSSLENLLDVQRQLTQQKIVDNLPDLYAGVKLQSDNYLNEIKALESSKQHYDSMLKYIEKGNFENSISSLLDTGKLSLGGDRISTQMAADIQRALGDLGIDTILTPILDAAGNVESNMLQLLTTVTSEQIQAAKNNINVAIDSIAQEYNGKIDELSVDIVKATNENQANWSSLSSSIFSWLQTEPEFKILDDNMQSMVQTVINNLDYSALNFESWDDAQKWISENIIGLFSNKDIGNKVSEQLNNMFKLKSDFKAGDMGIDDYKSKLQAYVEFVKGLDVDPKVQENLLKMFGLDPTQIDLEKGKMHLGETIQEMKNHAAKLVTDEGLLGDLTYDDLQILFQVDANTTPAAKSVAELENMIKNKKIELTTDFTTANYADYAESIESISSNISTYQDALENLGSGSFTIADFVELISQFPELAEGVDVASGEFKGLAKNLAKAIKNAPDDLVDELKDLKKELEDAGKETGAIDNLINSLEDMPEDALDGVIDKYGSLIDVVNAAKAAQEALNAAMSKNPNEGFETRGNAIEQMKTLMEQDAIGSESELWDIAEAFGFKSDSAKSLRENADALYEFIRARESWYKTDKDGNANYEGTESFIESAEKAIQSEDFKNALAAALGTDPATIDISDYIKWDYEDGVFDFGFDNANWDAIVKALSETSELTGLTSNEFKDLLTQIGMFFEVEWRDAEDIGDSIQTIADGSGTAEEKIKKMTDTVEKYVEKALGQDIDFDNLTEGVIDGLGEIDPKIKQLLLDYLKLKEELSKDPLRIKATIDKDGADGLIEIQELLGVINKNDDGTIAFDILHLRETLSDLGYTSAAIDEVINKIKEYNNLVKTPPSDPLGINNSQKTTQSIISGLHELGVEYKITKSELGEPLTIETNIDSLTQKLAQNGWTPAQIETYISQLQDVIDNNSLNISFNSDINPDTPNTEETTTTATEEKNVVVNVDATSVDDANQKVDELNGNIDTTNSKTATVNVDSTQVETAVTQTATVNENLDTMNGKEATVSIDVTQVEDVTTKANVANDALTNLSNTEVSINVNAEELDETINKVDTTKQKLQELDELEISANVDPTELDNLISQIEEAKLILEELKNSDDGAGIGVDGAAEVQSILKKLVQQKQLLEQPLIMKISVPDDGSDVDKVINKIQEFKDAYDNLEIQMALDMDADSAQKELESLREELQNMDINILTKLNINPEASIETINAQISSITPEVLARVKLDTSAVDGYDPADKDAKVVYTPDTSAVDAWQPPVKYGTVIYTVGGSSAGGLNNPGSVHITGGGRLTMANGTAHVKGTAYRSGSFGAPKSEDALVGELGPELLVRDGMWTTIGDGGAEFVHIKKGDIIFNHKQTESLLKNGYVTGRGRAYAEGTAFASGTAYASGGGAHKENAYVFSDTASKISSAAKSFSDAADDFEETFDWIEVRLEEINERIDLKSAKLENTVGSKKQNDTIDEIIKLNRTLYDNLIAGANKYYSYAEQILAKIPAQYHEAVKDGSIDIELFKGEANEKVLEAIEEYRDWVQKGADATQEAEEVLTEISDLAKEAFDNIVTEYENKVSLNDSKIDQLDAYNELTETDLGAESANIYNAIIEETNKNIEILEKQRNAMQDELNKRVESGEIKKYSDDWYDAVNAISEVDTEIIELTTDIEDYQDSINELHWDHFDNLIDRLQMVSDEAENLIDVLSPKDLVDKETGEWTDEGIASLGLYAQQMENAEVQAKKYKEEIDYLNKNWKKLGYTEQEYVEKLDELKSGQYDAIKAYNDTKDAIVELNEERIDAIKEGIEKEIEAYEELIEKKQEELDAEKDLHDFQKGVADQQKEIADIERKLAALSSDNSASARAKRAQLQSELLKAQAELEETYYERSVEDQQNALDKELENFQKEKEKEMEGWDEYLEDTELVVSESLAVVQANTDIVYQTLQQMGEEYSLSITDALTSPWAEGEKAIQEYSEKFGLSMSATVDELKEISAEYKKFMEDIEGYGKEAAQEVSSNAKIYQNEQSKKEEVSKKTQQEKHIAVGGKINAGSAKIYSSIGDKEGNKQYYSSDPIYTVLDIDGEWVKVRHHKRSTGISGWFKKSQIQAYAKGSTNVKKNQLALIDELGEELIIRPSNGRMTFLEKGSGVVPANLTANLMEWGKLDPSMMLDQNRPKIDASPSVVNNNMEISIDASVGELIHVDQLNGNNLAEVTKIVDKAWDKYMKELNGYIRRYVK